MPLTKSPILHPWKDTEKILLKIYLWKVSDCNSTVYSKATNFFMKLITVSVQYNGLIYYKTMQSFKMYAFEKLWLYCTDLYSIHSSFIKMCIFTQYTTTYMHIFSFSLFRHNLRQEAFTSTFVITISLTTYAIVQSSEWHLTRKPPYSITSGGSGQYWWHFVCRDEGKLSAHQDLKQVSRVFSHGSEIQGTTVILCWW